VEKVVAGRDHPCLGPGDLDRRHTDDAFHRALAHLLVARAPFAVLQWATWGFATAGKVVRTSPITHPGAPGGEINGALAKHGSHIETIKLKRRGK